MLRKPFVQTKAPRKDTGVTEHAIQNALLAQLELLGIYAWRVNTGVARDPRTNQVVRFGKVGQADITGILPNGRRLEIECKDPDDGVLKQKQREFGDAITASGGLYILARDVRSTLAIVKEAAGL